MRESRCEGRRCWADQKQTDLANIVGEMLGKALQAVLDKADLTEEQKAKVKAELKALPAA